MTISYQQIMRYHNRFVLLAIFFLPAMGIAQTAESIPEGAGKDVLISKCVTCHGLSTALAKRASRMGWEQTINKMIDSYSANISNLEKAELINYMAEHYNESAVSNRGQQTVAEQCFQCHGDGMWQDVFADRNGWLSVIYRMVGRGGKWTQEQIDLMADYLAQAYPQGDEK